jgi:glycosyltransferase involved in cell wall biosynthesis
MIVVQLMASPFFGGPERQMLGLARALPASCRSIFVTFSERGLCRTFLNEVRDAGFEGIELKFNFPAIARAVTEIAGHLRRSRADLICCNGYKPDLLGLLAARQVGIPAVSISHGWTAATAKVRIYEGLDRLTLPWMDAVVCVSQGQADKVRRAKVRSGQIEVICNAVDLEKFGEPQPRFRQELERLFPAKPKRIVGAGGRLSPEKGFEVLIDAAAQVARRDAETSFVVFGEGTRRAELERRIARLQLAGRFVLPGFCARLEDYLPHFDVVALPSYTEGMPVVVLEAFAARRPVVATSVGGVPEVVEDGVSGLLVPPGDAVALASKLCALLTDESRCLVMGQQGRARVERSFTFAAQRQQYLHLFERLTDRPKAQRRNSHPPAAPAGSSRESP